MSQALDTQDSTFQSEVLESSVPVLVDFWAPWCAPCKAMGPLVDQLAEELGSQIKVVKHNTQDHADVPVSLGVQSIPTFIVFKNGEEVARHVGGMRKYEEFKSFVTPHLTD